RPRQSSGNLYLTTCNLLAINNGVCHDIEVLFLPFFKGGTLMNRTILSQIVCLIVLSYLHQAANGAVPGVSSTFEFNSGPTLSTSFGQPESTQNWVGTFFGLAPHSGAQYFESDNGNFNSDFSGMHYAKQLGGTIENIPYAVSFYIATNSLGGQGMIAVQYSDFSELAIGGAGGTTVWSS